MKYWLLKTEAETFSIDDLERVKKEPWSGVRNFVARNHLRAMAVGDQCFIYHTGSEKRIVGIGNVVSEPYPDPTQFDEKISTTLQNFCCVGFSTGLVAGKRS